MNISLSPRQSIASLIETINGEPGCQEISDNNAKLAYINKEMVSRLSLDSVPDIPSLSSLTSYEQLR